MTPDESHLPFEQQSLEFRLRKRAEIRSGNTERKSVREGRPDRIAALLIEAADEIARLTAWQPMETAPTDGRPCYVVGRYTYATAGFPQEAMQRDGKWYDAHGTELIVWAWMPRPEGWPHEPRSAA